MPEVRDVPRGDTPDEVLGAVVKQLRADLDALRSTVLARTSGLDAAYLRGADVMAAFLATSETTTSAAYTNLATVGPAVTLTTGARALVIVGCNTFNSLANGVDGMSFAISGATTRAATDNYAFTATSSIASAQFEGVTVSYLDDLTPGSNTFTGKYYAGGGGTGTFRRRRLIVIAL